MCRLSNSRHRSSLLMLRVLSRVQNLKFSQLRIGINLAPSSLGISRKPSPTKAKKTAFQGRSETLMCKNAITFLAAVALGLSAAVFAVGQTQTTTTTVTKTVQNPDGTYTVIEYPVGKETTVSLN